MLDPVFGELKDFLFLHLLDAFFVDPRLSLSVPLIFDLTYGFKVNLDKCKIQDFIVVILVLIDRIPKPVPLLL